jgi:hypothetical protein
MNWDAVSAISAIVGAAAVVVSLLYLAVQIRSQNRESRIASVHQLNESFRDAITAFQNPELANVFVRAKDNFASLPETERLQFISMIQGIFRVWEDAYHQHQEKILSERVWNAMVVQFSGYLSLPGVIAVWSIRKPAYSEDFRAFVDSTTPLEYKSK